MKKLIKKLGFLIYSTRPSACLMVGVFVMVAFRPTTTEIRTALILFIAAVSGSAFCFLLNDIYDRRKDQLNNKNRPIAAGKLSPLEAFSGAFIFLSVYLLASFALGSVVFRLALLSIFLFVIYSPINQKGGVLANLLVALCASGSVWGVAIIRDYDTALFYLSGLIFLMVVIREVLLDWLDVEGDEAIGKPSLPIALGKVGTLRFITIFMILISSFVAAAPFITSISNLTFLFLGLALVTAWIPLVRLLREQTAKQVLFNIRFSHVTFVFVVLGILFR